ncbi:MAG: DUF4382 domain-containing protein [Nitrososphaerota archaeon]|nr:DUF4382 domain-containing protein [Nitrososphaerota archaeon]MDG7024856.1 DUF4382 domain-containing protein [Nitrososphaerota archaeon]
MSVRRQALKYTVAALAVAAAIILSSTFYLNQSIGTGVQGGTQASLAIQLTDPPTVPRGTSSLNLTYSSISLLVGEPASGGQQTTRTVTVTNSATLDLLRLQNISQTIALASLPSGTVVYSFNLTVTGISIDVNGTKSPVTLATGGSALSVTLPTPSAIQGSNIALLRLSPVIVSTPGGYQMIPSAVGIVRSERQGESQRQVGSQQTLTLQDENQLRQAQGNLTANLTALSVAGNSSTVTVQVENTGNSSVVLNAIAIHGNFSAVGNPCGSYGTTETQTQTEGEDRATSTTTTTTFTRGECEMEHMNEVVFVPVNSTVSGTSCVALKMNLVNYSMDENGYHGLTLAKGQCVTLTFSGEIAFGNANFVLVPSTAVGQTYGIHVIASEGANNELSCQLPLTSSSCSAVRQEDQ